jgi:hypothetical protein
MDLTRSKGEELQSQAREPESFQEQLLLLLWLLELLWSPVLQWKALGWMAKDFRFRTLFVHQCN